MKLVNEEFPWMHIVKGKARKPSTQGSIEVSHRAFKAALVKWLDKKGSPDWVLGAHIVQCEVNHCPMRSRGNISPHTIYYGKPPVATYSALLGPAYKVAETEYGLRLAKRVLLQVKTSLPTKECTTEEVKSFIKAGDEVWATCVEDTEEDSELLLNIAFHACLDKVGIQLDPNVSIQPDSPEYKIVEDDEGIDCDADFSLGRDCNIFPVHENLDAMDDMNQTATAFVDVYETSQANEDIRELQEQQVMNVHNVHEPPTPEKNNLAIEGKQAAAFHENDTIPASIASNLALEEIPECDNADMIVGSPPSTNFLNINATPFVSTELAIEGKQAAAFHENDRIPASIASNLALEEIPECDNVDMSVGSPSTNFLNINATPSASTDGPEGNLSVSDS